MIERKDLGESELAAGLTLIDPLLFRMYFFADELTEEPSLEQKLMFCDESDRVLLCTSRKIAKTINLEATVFQQGFVGGSKTGGVDEALMFTPRDAHMAPFVDRIWSRWQRTPIFEGMVRTQSRGENTVLEFRSGLRWYFRIEGSSGSAQNMVGLRAVWIIGDELAFGNQVCHNSRLQTALPGCKWIYAGVPNGVRSTPFYRLDQTNMGYSWSRHKYPTFINPIYRSPEGRDQLIEDYGGEETQGYKNDVLGEWGEEMQSSFPPGSVAIRPSLPYFVREIYDTKKPDLEVIGRVIGIGTVRCKYYALGWDYGYSPDPAVIIGAYSNDGVEWQAYFRLVMRRVPIDHQVEIARFIIHNCFNGQFVGIACDDLKSIQLMQAADKDENIPLYIWGWPGASRPVPMTTGQDEDGRPIIEIVNRPMKEMMTEWLKTWMINAIVGIEGRKLWLGNDPAFIDELIGTTERKSPFGRISYQGPPDPERKNAMADHNSDGARELCQAIEDGMANLPTDDEGMDFEGLGWVGDDSVDWKAPWE